MAEMPDKSVVSGVTRQPAVNVNVQAPSEVDASPPQPTQIPTPKKVADRPHWVTIVIGILSPLIAVVAVGIAMQSLRTSQQSMKVGQRAYLNYQVAVTNADEIVGKLREDKDFFLNYQIVVTNLGNTPAESISPKINVVVDPDRTPVMVNFSPLPFELASKESRVLAGQALFKHIHNVRGLPGLATGFVGQVEYTDVFGDWQAKQVCYTFIVSGGVASGGMCGTVMQKWQVK